MESSPLHPAFDRPTAHPKVEELAATHDPVLPTRKIRNGLIPRSRRQFSTCEVGFCRLDSHATEREADGRACGAHFVPTSNRCAHEKRPQPAVAASGFDPFK
jgi:hypothetical protein